MKRKNSALRLYFSLSTNPFLLFFIVLIAIIIGLSSFSQGLSGGYIFQAESMHWLQFRGPNASGIAPENADPPVHFSADTNLLWKVEMLSGWSSPCIVNDKIFLTGFNDIDSLLYTVAINRENGEILWKDSITPHNYFDIYPVNSYASPTVASNGNNVFAYFPNYGLNAYDLNGDKIWDFQHDVTFGRGGGSISPLVIDSIIILNINCKGDPRILALSCETGDTIWMVGHPEHQDASESGDATPVIWKDFIILHRWNEILALNLFDGQPEWWLNTPSIGIGTPVILDDLLFVNTWTQFGAKSVRDSQLTFDELVSDYDINANMKIEKDEFPDDMMVYERPGSSDLPNISMSAKDDRVWAWFDWNEDGAFDEDEWNGMWEWALASFGEHGMLALPLDGSGERPVTDIKWKVNEDSPEVPSPLVVNENVLFITNGGTMTVINRETGEVVHKDRIGAAGSYLSSPMLAGNRIYTCSNNGTVTVLSADDFSILANNKLKEKIGASPVAVDDVLYIRTDKHLYAFRDQ
jgi:outer membrane protein assembly factor BamB